MTPRVIPQFFLLCLSVTIGLGHQHLVYGEQEIFPFLGEITADQVNVRAGQSANFERLCQLDTGDEVVVVGKEYSWYKIQLPPTARSYVSKTYIQYLGQSAGGIVADRVNIRAGAGTHNTVVGQLEKGEQIFIKEELEEWYRIVPVAKSYGWVAEQYLKFKSVDVEEYQARVYAPPSFEEESLEPDEGRLDEEDVETEEIETFSAVGYVEKYDVGETIGIYYKIVERGRPVCYIQGVNHILGRFIHQKVFVEGIVNKKLRSKFAYPVIQASTVRLML
ncbi:MAG: SH3 domain-containing protein [Candidatus Omnitrophica bacterium]|nr:SH3 domain-containing protein [Candidatus Omnitrophota bacterium]